MAQEKVQMNGRHNAMKEISEDRDCSQMNGVVPKPLDVAWSDG